METLSKSTCLSELGPPYFERTRGQRPSKKTQCGRSFYVLGRNMEVVNVSIKDRDKCVSEVVSNFLYKQSWMFHGL